MTQELVDSARAEALFTTSLQRSDDVTVTQVRMAVTRAVREHGTRGCAALVAMEYGEHPEVAVDRMRWALDTVKVCFGKPSNVRSLALARPAEALIARPVAAAA